MCLAIEIYLHYYSVLTMRQGTLYPTKKKEEKRPQLAVRLTRSLGASTRQALSTAMAKPAPNGAQRQLLSVLFGPQLCSSTLRRQLLARVEQAEHLQNVNLLQRINSSVK